MSLKAFLFIKSRNRDRLVKERRADEHCSRSERDRHDRGLKPNRVFSGSVPVQVKKI